MRFTPNKPVELTEPTVKVDAGLPAGRYRFRLVVVGARSGRTSEPMEVTVQVEGRLPIPGPVPPIIIR